MSNVRTDPVFFNSATAAAFTPMRPGKSAGALPTTSWQGMCMILWQVQSEYWAPSSFWCRAEPAFPRMTGNT